MILFSIIMPVYNRESIVGTAIESVLAQEYTFFELICIDDGSEDDTSNVLSSYASKDKRVVIRSHKSNQGRSAARNTGIKAAAGQWLCFLDSDDVYFPSHLSEHVKLVNTRNEYNCFATGQLIYGKPKLYPFRLPDAGRQIVLEDLITGNFISLNQLSIRRDAAPLFSPETISYAEDLLYMRRILENNKLLLTNVITTDVLPIKTRSLLTERTIKIASDNWAAALSFCTNEHKGRINRKILSHTALFCTSMLQSAGEIRNSFYYFRKAFSFGNTLFQPLFYKVLLKYMVSPFLKK